MKMYKLEEEEQCYKCNQLITETPMEFTDAVQTEESGEDGWEERSLCTECYMEKNKLRMLKNKNTGEERPLIRCGITRCNQVVHLGEEMGYDKNYDVFCEGCSDDMFVARGEIDDDWISGDIGWAEIDAEADQLLYEQENK